jgi:phospholipase C
MVGFTIAAVAALSSLALAAPPQIQEHGGDASWKSKIKNVVVLVEENRSFDTFCGGLNYDPSINGLLHHNYCNSM